MIKINYFSKYVSNLFRPKKKVILSGDYDWEMDNPSDITVQYDIQYLKWHWVRMLKDGSLYFFVWTRFIERKDYLGK